MAQKNNTLYFLIISNAMVRVCFVKSRKSHDKVHQFYDEMYRYGLSKGIYIKEYIVEESAGIDIDRESIDRLMHELEQGGYECVVVTNVSDFTKDADDLLQFLMHLKDMNCSVYSASEGRFVPTLH